MKIAVISDLHLGRRDAVDHFGHEDSRFLEFLRFLESEFERIVLLGDIYETLTSRAPYQQVAELAAARAAHPELVRRFASPKYQYVHGNHDLITARTEAAPERWVVEADGVKLLFTHGHGHDWIIRRARFLSEWGVWLGAWLRRVGLSPVFHAFDRWDAALRGAAHPEGRPAGFRRNATAIFPPWHSTSRACWPRSDCPDLRRRPIRWRPWWRGRGWSSAADGSSRAHFARRG